MVERRMGSGTFRVRSRPSADAGEGRLQGGVDSRSGAAEGHSRGAIRQLRDAFPTRMGVRRAVSTGKNPRVTRDHIDIMIARFVPPALLALMLSCSVAAFAVATTDAASDDLTAFVKALPAPGARDRTFLEIPSVLLDRLAIKLSTIQSVDPGLVCDLSAKVPSMSEATLGRVGQVQTVCTPAGWSQGLITLHDGTSYVTTCGDPTSARLTANLDVTVGTHSLHGSVDSAPPARALSHSCSGWTKVQR